MAVKDELDRGPLIAQLTAAIVGRGEAGMSSRIVALTGPWGSGKSWLIEEVRHSLNGITREFNPWLYSDELGLYRGYATFLLERVKDKKAKRKIARALDYVGPSMKGFGFDISGSVREAAEAMKGLSNPTEITRQLTKHLGGSETPTYVLVDDLDRLTPAELLLFFKLLRLVGDLPGIVYVLVYDEQVLLQLLAQTEVGGRSVDRARLYLDKIVEARVSMPRLTRMQWQRHLLEPLQQFGLQIKGSFAESDVEQRNFVWALETAMWGKLTTKRAIDRLVEAVRSLPAPLYGELNYLDWCRICYVRVVHPQTWQLIVDHPDIFAAEHVGSGARFMQGGGKERTVQVADVVASMAFTSFEAEDLLDLLEDLFPRFAANRASSNHPYSSEPDRTGQHIGDERYFYRYFSHQLPDKEVSDMQIRALLRGLETEDYADTSEELAQMFRAKPQDTLVAISRRQAESVAARPLFDFLCGLALLPELNYKSGIFQTPGSSDLLRLGIEVLQRADAATLESLNIPQSGPVELLLIAAIEHERQPAGSGLYVEWVESQRIALALRADAELRNAPSPLDEKSQAGMWMHYLWSLDKPRTTALFKDLLRNGQWRSDDLASTVLQYRRGPGEPTTLKSLHLNDSLSADQELKALFLAGIRAPYPKEWDQEPSMVLDDYKLEGPQLGAYVLAKLEREPGNSEDADDEIEPA